MQIVPLFIQRGDGKEKLFGPLVPLSLCCQELLSPVVVEPVPISVLPDVGFPELQPPVGRVDNEPRLDSTVDTPLPGPLPDELGVGRAVGLHLPPPGTGCNECDRDHAEENRERGENPPHPQRWAPDSRHDRPCSSFTISPLVKIALKS